MPEKEYLVALDFIGNFRQSYVAPLALQGYNSVEDYRKARLNKTEEKKLPSACYISSDTEVQRIWESEIRRVLTPDNRINALKSLYLEFRSNINLSPSLMDFFVNPAIHDPYIFLKEKKFGGNWLRVKEYMKDLTEYEQTILGTHAEKFLQHLEKELNPVKSYKMVVLQSLLKLKGTEWKIENIAKLFLDYYLENKNRIIDWDDLAKFNNPSNYPITKVVAHLIRMPLDKLENTGGEFFVLDRKIKTFKIREEYHVYWLNIEFQKLIADRVDFGLARYFYRKKSVTAQDA